MPVSVLGAGGGGRMGAEVAGFITGSLAGSLVGEEAGVVEVGAGAVVVGLEMVGAGVAIGC